MTTTTDIKKGDRVMLDGMEAEVFVVTLHPVGHVHTIRVKWTDRHGKLMAATVYPSEVQRIPS